jgi:DNA-binding NarL/FixJ family response regulator
MAGDMMDKIRVIVVDDHPLFRQGLRNLLGTESDLQVVGEAESGEQAIERVRECMPDVVMMDVNLPGINGLEATRLIKSVSSRTNVVILTAYDDEEQMYHAIRAGASAFYAKDVEPTWLLEGIRIVNRGQYVIGQQVLNEEQLGEWLIQEFGRFGGEFFELDNGTTALSPLSTREMEILRLLIRGMSNKEIAYHLGISHQTVKNHMTAIFGKLGVADRTQAAVYALRHGWVPLHGREV